jgi:hypothetical protein
MNLFFNRIGYIAVRNAHKILTGKHLRKVSRGRPVSTIYDNRLLLEATVWRKFSRFRIQSKSGLL